MCYSALAMCLELKQKLAERLAKHTLHVHSCFEKAINLETEEGKLVTLLSKTKKMVPYGICLPLDSMPRLSVGRRVLISSTDILIEGKCYSLVDTPAIAPTMHRPALTTNAQGLSHFLSVTSQKGGLFDAYRFLLDLDDKVNCGDLLTENALSRIKGLVDALNLNEVTTESVKGLVGMGQGLTPSGDDFIVGLLSALWACESHKRFSLGKSCLPHLSSTTKVSAEMLSHAIEGRFSQVVLDFYRGERQELLGFLSYGHTSGHDILCGIHAGLSFVIT